MWLVVAQRRSQIGRMFALLSLGAKLGAKRIRGSRQHPRNSVRSAALSRLPRCQCAMLAARDRPLAHLRWQRLANLAASLGPVVRGGSRRPGSRPAQSPVQARNAAEARVLGPRANAYPCSPIQPSPVLMARCETSSLARVHGRLIGGCWQGCPNRKRWTEW
jgi:hypothetical protein